MLSSKKKIMVFADWYAPGYKAGGPIRSCVNFVRYMQEDYDVYVFTSDRDLGDTASYPGITCDRWIEDGKTRILYASPEMMGWGLIKRQLAQIRPDYIYLNSMFSVKFTLMPQLINKLSGSHSRVVLSPRGMLRASAVQFKSSKKKLFFRAFRLLGLHRDIHFIASDQTELQDIRHYFGESPRVTVLPNFPAPVRHDPTILGKISGELSMVYVGRIHPIKNLDYLLKVMADIPATIRLTIVGSIEQSDFWDQCQAIIRSYPPNIRVEYAGERPNHELPAIIDQHHIFAQPTKGENFGHAIFEALALGKPVLISDQTPWRDLQKAGAGWDLPLDSPGLFREAIGIAAAMDQQQYQGLCRTTSKFIEGYVSRLDLKADYSKIFS